jgi:hypothetical protein
MPATPLRLVETAHIRVAAIPGLAIGESGVWVLTETGVARIDPATSSLRASIPMTRSFTKNAVATGEGGVWVSNLSGDAPDDNAFENSVSRIDPVTNRVIANVPVPDAQRIEVGAGSVWTTTPGNGTPGDPTIVSRIDPSTDRVVARIPVRAAGPVDMAFGEEALWLSDLFGRLYRIDPADQSVRRIGVGEFHVQTVGDGTVWGYSGTVRGVGRRPELKGAAASDSITVSILRLNPRTGGPVGNPIRIPVRGASIVLGAGYAWAEGWGLIWRIDPRAGRLVGNPVRLSSPVLGMAADSTGLWVSAGNYVYRFQLCREVSCGRIKPTSTPTPSASPVALGHPVPVAPREYPLTAPVICQWNGADSGLLQSDEGICAYKPSSIRFAT